MTSKKQQRWYLGGGAACMAACFTHPLDTIKVHLQTQQGSSGLMSPSKDRDWSKKHVINEWYETCL